MAKQRPAVYVEVGSKRAFASAVDWPGWSRGGRDEAAALEQFVAYGPRYRSSLRAAARDLEPPADVGDLEVVERLTGNASTDFGVPAMPSAADDGSVDDANRDRLTRILRASWAAFDRAAESATGVELRKGPRGGGRDVEKIVEHVREAERSYLTQIGGRIDGAPASDGDEMAVIRAAVVTALEARARGEPPPPSRRSAPLWTPRYFVRRSAWHALDHAWEIEDRST